MAKFNSAPRTTAEKSLCADLQLRSVAHRLGLDNSLVEHSASYIQGWLKALRNDPKAVVFAALKRSVPPDFIRGEIEGPDEVWYKRSA